ncbi:hypothetical protein PVK06_035852 [Gossypium arboreum]|uniref:RNase H type-1 domain-containing protein n=1 Tax=Gossypium arboreum TaxID=29729 RepID=A0ABR0NKZ8_GOSAR|nr:hypothetical protein PVK06_035852 [Gossypium arboreum]
MQLGITILHKQCGNQLCHDGIRVSSTYQEINGFCGIYKMKVVYWFLKIEARAILEGLKLAWNKRFKRVELESDNAMLIETIRSDLASVRVLMKSRRYMIGAQKLGKSNFDTFTGTPIKLLTT